MTITFDVLRAVSPHATAARLDIFVGPIQCAIEEFEIRKVAAFLANTSHESAGYTVLEENLNYTAERLMAVWPRRFPDMTSALPYARNPQALAERVYGGRMGNTEPGDGWRFRGRGIMQTTGRANYERAGQRLNLPLLEHPDWLLQPVNAARSAAAFWVDNRLDEIDDFVAQVKVINGGTNGLAERQALYARAVAALGAA